MLSLTELTEAYSDDLPSITLSFSETGTHEIVLTGGNRLSSGDSAYHSVSVYRVLPDTFKFTCTEIVGIASGMQPFLIDYLNSKPCTNHK